MILMKITTDILFIFADDDDFTGAYWLEDTVYFTNEPNSNSFNSIMSYTNNTNDTSGTGSGGNDDTSDGEYTEPADDPVADVDWYTIL